MLSGDGGSKGRSIENTYKKMSPIEHVLLRPGMYVGGTKVVDMTGARKHGNPHVDGAPARNFFYLRILK